MLAISRCFAGSIAANPRFEPPLLFVAMIMISQVPVGRHVNAGLSGGFTMLIKVSELLFTPLTQVRNSSMRLLIVLFQVNLFRPWNQ